MTQERLSLGDNVRVRTTEVTKRHGAAGMRGQVYGETTPSATGVDVIGDSTTDYAVNVFFDELDKGYWFAPNLLEFLDHAPGTEIVIGNHRWVRADDGEWIEPDADKPIRRKRPWWRLW